MKLVECFTVTFTENIFSGRLLIICCARILKSDSGSCMWREEMMVKLNILDLWEEEENKIMLREKKSRDQKRQYVSGKNCFM